MTESLSSEHAFVGQTTFFSTEALPIILEKGKRQALGNGLPAVLQGY